jgi:enoyl-CoA hydratase/carnithine racemase
LVSRGERWRAIRLARDGPVVTLTLNRPEVLNAYNTVMRDEVYAALSLVAADRSVLVMIVCGAGSAFSSGGDLSEFGTAPSPVRAREVRQLRDVWRLWARLPCVSIAAVHGFAAGGGCEMALLCDLVVCTRSARFGLPETGLGLIPGVGGTQTLPRAIGCGRAAEMLLSGRFVDGEEAARIGLATAAVAEGRLMPAARALARRITALDATVVRATKQALRRGLDLPLVEALALERRLADAIGRTNP